MKIWVDDVRPAPEGKDWEWARSANEAIKLIMHKEDRLNTLIELIKCAEEIFGYERETVKTLRKLIPCYSVDLIDLDHDAGEYASDGGDYIKILDWLVERGTLYPVRIHTMNPVGRENMQRMIDRYWGKQNA